jgi:hypothetical protein
MKPAMAFRHGAMTTGALVLARLSRAFTPSLWRSKMRCAPSGAFANANRPSAPTTTDIPLPSTATLTPAGLAFDIPEAMTICPDTPPAPQSPVTVSR